MERQFKARQRGAMIARGAHLLSVRQHQSIHAEKAAKPAVYFEIPLTPATAPCPIKRLEKQEKPEISLEQISLKLT